MEQMKKILAQQNEQASASAIPPCTIAKNNYTAAKITMANTTSEYEKCSKENPSQYSAPDQILQPIPDPQTQRQIVADTLKSQLNEKLASYTALLTSTKALMAATQPLKNYKSILQTQLNATSQQNETLKQTITSGEQTVNASISADPQLSNTGPFGTINSRTGIIIGFLFFNSLFYILLSIVLYLRYKNSISPGVLYSGLAMLILFGGIGGGYMSYIVLSMWDNMDSYIIFVSMLEYIFPMY